MADKKFKTKNGWALLEAPESPTLTNEMIEEWEREEYDEEYKRAFSAHSDSTQT